MLGTRNALDRDLAYVSIVAPANGANSTIILSRTDGTLPQTNGGWQSAVADLSQYDGQTIQVTFTFRVTCPNPPDPEGWYVDDVAIVNSPPPPVISGTKYEDVNGDDADDPSKVGVADDKVLDSTNPDYIAGGVEVDLLDATGTIVQKVNTGADGKYAFAPVAPGTYTVQEVVPDGWTQTGPASSSVVVAPAEAPPS